MKKNEILKTAFLQASEKEWAEQNEAPFEMSDDFKAKINGIISNANEGNNTPVPEKRRINIPYIKRLVVAAVVMALFAAISVVTVWGVDEYYSFTVSDTLYGLKLENRIERSSSSKNTDSEENILAQSSDSESDHASEDTESWTHVYSNPTDSDHAANDINSESDNDLATPIWDSDIAPDDNTDYEMREESDIDYARPATDTTDADKTYSGNISAKFAPKFPSDYKKTYTFSNDDVFMLTYENENDKIEFSQRILDIDEYIPEPENTFVDTYVHGREGTKYQIIVRPDGNTTILWGKYGYSFIMSSSQINYKDLIEIAETLTVIKE